MKKLFKPNKAKIKIPMMTLALFVATLLSSPGIEAQEPAAPVRDVEVRMFLIDVEDINDTSQSFTANLALVMRWRDPGLAHSGPESISVPLAVTTTISRVRFSPAFS